MDVLSMNYEIRSKKAFCKKKSPSICQDPSWSLETLTRTRGLVPQQRQRRMQFA